MRLGLAFVLVGLLSSCALVSGLDGIKVSTEDASTSMDAGDAAVVTDAPSGNDSGQNDSAVPSDGGTDFALNFQNTCATGNTAFPFSNQSFTVSFWLRPDVPTFSNELKPYVYNGGRNAADPGWSIGVNGFNLVFCAGDGAVAPTCASAQGQGSTLQHLIHLVGVSNAAGMNGKRDLAMYALDVTAGNTSHQLVASATGAPVAWQTQAIFGVGGQPANNTCLNTLPGVIDDVRLWNRALALQEIEQSYKVSLSCQDASLVGNFTFDEGTGMTTVNRCGAFKSSLAINAATWMVSPFP